jgi:hypothetical protein
VQAADAALQRDARFMNKGGRQSAHLFGSMHFSPNRPLDSFWACAQDHSYTNEPRRAGNGV